MKKKIVVAIMALVVTMIVCNDKAYAEDVTPTPTPTQAPSRINSLVGSTGGSGGRLSVNTIFEYYNRHLSTDQKQIVNYLVGMYNYTYISARGFQYRNLSTTDQLINRLISFGTRFFESAQSNYSSRLDSYMQEYLSAVISYAGTITSSFNTWIDSISSNEEEYLYIPFTKDSLNSWTNFYNDPSVYGVENFGKYDSDWESGQYYDFGFAGYVWDNSTVESNYNNFILNYSPVIYSNIVTYQANGYTLERQRVVSMKDIPVYNSLFIQRSTGIPHNFRFGIYDNGLVQYSGTTPMFFIEKNSGRNGLFGYQDSARYNNNINTYNGNNNIAELIDYAFFRTPFFFSTNVGGVEYYWSDFYPYISHVYLVDDLNTLSNIEEIFNTTDLEVTGTDVWIQMPDDDYYWQIQPTLNPDLQDLVDVNGDPIPDNGLKQQIVNNTVINNYDIIAPGAIINVPVDWLQGEGNYLEYTNTTAFPFFVMVGDIFEALGEIRIFIIGVLILGLAAGVVVKFLL